MIAVSACLVGKNTKYDGSNNYNEKVLNFLKNKEYILICPEVLGGLSIPRLPSEKLNDKIINQNNEDVTNNFILGANKTLDMLKKYDIDLIIVKSNSPSCGYQKIYDGTFSNKLITGNGVFTDLALKNNYKIITEKDI